MSTTETKVRHTPGSWFVERAGRNPRVLAKPNGFRSTPENPVFVVTNNVYISADKDEATANAHLIAAAPDMLEALEDALEYLMDGTPDDCKSPAELAVTRRIENAIARATGKL